LRGFLKTRKPISSEQRVYLGNKLFSCVEAVETYRLVLKNPLLPHIRTIYSSSKLVAHFLSASLF
jgi:hypothetical protein